MPLDIAETDAVDAARAAVALPAGARAKVTKVQGLLLTVEPVDTGSLHTNH